MTYVVPNYFLEENPDAVISSDAVLTLTYSSRKSQSNFMIRNTTHVMILLMEGCKKLTHEEKISVLHEGSILLLTQGNYVMSEVLSEAGKYEALMVYFDDGFVLDFMHQYGIKAQGKNESNFVSFHSDRRLKSLVDSFSLYINQPIEQKNAILKLKTQELFLHLLSEQKEKFLLFLHAISHSSSHRVAHILEANLDMIRSVEDMSKIARVSTYELRRELDKTYGISPKAWLDSKRLEQASLLLKTTDETLTSIATTCGYSTLSWFGVQFKKVYGVTPKRYREENS